MDSLIVHSAAVDRREGGLVAGRQGRGLNETVVIAGPRARTHSPAKRCRPLTRPSTQTTMAATSLQSRAATRHARTTTDLKRCYRSGAMMEIARQTVCR